MANRHFGKLADVWKHLVLAEVLSTDVPTRVFDTHAGHAIYPMSEDAERAYGVVGFLDVTSPGTGFGMVTANASAFAVAQCTQLGIALAHAYEGRPLPNGRVGALDFQTLSP